MTKGQDYEVWVREHDAADIEQVESAFLEQVHLYLTNKIPYKVLVIFCVDNILNQKAARFIDPEMYNVMSEVALLSTELTATINRLEQLRKTDR